MGYQILLFMYCILLFKSILYMIVYYLYFVLIKENDLIMIKADKGAGLILLNREEQNNKVTLFLSENKYKEIKTNPLQQQIKQTKNIIRNTKDTLEHFDINTYKLIHMNPQIPKLYGQPKLHKINTPYDRSLQHSILAHIYSAKL